MILKAAILVSLTTYISQAVAVNLTQSNWIWTDDQGKKSSQSNELRAFQRFFHHAEGKVPVAAEFFVASGHPHDLFVNDRHIGWFDGSGNDGTIGRVHRVSLESGPSVFAIKTHGGHKHIPAGLLSSIQIKFHDGSEEEYPSNSEWLAAAEPHVGVKPHWGKAKVLGVYGAEPWGTIIILPEPHHTHHGGGNGDGHHHPHHPHHPHAPAAPLTVANASWIWTNEVHNGTWGNDGFLYTDIAPQGSRAFRKTINVMRGITINSLNISLEVDNTFILYVQGKQIDTQADYATLFHYLVNLTTPVAGPGSIVVAVDGTNTDVPEGPAGLFAFIDLLGTNQRGKSGSQGQVVSDSTWKFNTTVPSGFEQPGFDDSTWQNATETINGGRISQ